MTDLTEIILEAIENVHDMDVTLEDYATAAAEAVKGAIKPLVWHKSHISGWNGDWHTLPTGYAIRCADENGWKWVSRKDGEVGYSETADAAKAAANAHHVASILSAMGVEG